YYDERAKERKHETIKFWKNVLPEYKVYVSEITIRELENTKNEALRRKFRHLIENFKVLKPVKKIGDLAEAYIDKGVFSEKYIDDALHVATASYYGISYLVSWNFEHLVKVKTRRSVNLVNMLEGYREVEIVSPQEL
ncbi:MAG: type II toxin-antitoxin system VapC family toxin, partial [Deferribacteres bacterium]|nr:type II toxin-antitoxin system VapC family toxin [Deferribacteres bacterium]